MVYLKVQIFGQLHLVKGIYIGFYKRNFVTCWQDTKRHIECHVTYSRSAICYSSSLDGQDHLLCRESSIYYPAAEQSRIFPSMISAKICYDAYP